MNNECMTLVVNISIVTIGLYFLYRFLTPCGHEMFPTPADVPRGPNESVTKEMLRTTRPDIATEPTQRPGTAYLETVGWNEQRNPFKSVKMLRLHKGRLDADQANIDPVIIRP